MTQTKTITNGSKERIEELKARLPDSHEKYTDKYFLRTGEILRAENLNPWVRAQVFIRKGPGRVYGVDEALEILDKYSNLRENGGNVWALNEGDYYNEKDTLMVIEARVQDIVELETMYLGVLSAETTLGNGDYGIDLERVRDTMSLITERAEGRPVSYFGARHWRFDRDAEIAKAAFDGGATSASTDIGAGTFGQKGIGTIPHALENIMAWKYGLKRGVVEATKAFDRVIDKEVPRVALIDYANKEIEDSVETARTLEGRLYGVRVDTCGENVAQGALAEVDYEALDRLVGREALVPELDEKYWFGNGVTITGVYSLRKALDDAGYDKTRIVLTSGFGNPEKVGAFVNAEKELGVKLFDALGVGGIYDSRSATMDIVAVGDDLRNMKPMSKVGRYYRPNSKLELRLGGRR